MSREVGVSARGTAMLLMLSGATEGKVLEGLQPALAAALTEGKCVVVDARRLTLVDGTVLDGIFSGLDPADGRLYLVADRASRLVDRVRQPGPVGVHPSVDDALVAIEARRPHGAPHEAVPAERM